MQSNYQIKFEFIDIQTDQLDTIEERSQECTPQFELARTIKDSSRGIKYSFNSNPFDLSNIQEIQTDLKLQIKDAKDSFNEYLEMLEKASTDPSTILSHIIKLQKRLKKLNAILQENKLKIIEADTENSALINKISELENADITNISQAICVNKCRII